MFLEDMCSQVKEERSRESTMTVIIDHIVYTTAEIVIGSAKGLFFSREHCEKSGWPELVVKKTE